MSYLKTLAPPLDHQIDYEAIQTENLQINFKIPLDLFLF